MGVRRFSDRVLWPFQSRSAHLAFGESTHSLCWKINFCIFVIAPFSQHSLENQKKRPPYSRASVINTCGTTLLDKVPDPVRSLRMPSHSLSANGDKTSSSTRNHPSLSPHPQRPTVIKPPMLPCTLAARSFDWPFDASSPHWFH